MSTVRIIQNVFSGGMLKFKAGEIAVDVDDSEAAKLVRRGLAEQASAVEERPAQAEKGKKAR